MDSTEPMTPTQPPAAEGASARDELADVLHRWVGILPDGYVIFTPDEIATITRALRDEARGIGSYPVACLEILQRLAARQPEGVRGGE